jgi:hypothetical protein
MEDGSFIKVSTSSSIKAVAGKIAHSSREGDPPAILTIGERPPGPLSRTPISSARLAPGAVSASLWPGPWQLSADSASTLPVSPLPHSPTARYRPPPPPAPLPDLPARASPPQAPTA